MAMRRGLNPLAAAFSARSRAICVDASPPYRKNRREVGSWKRPALMAASAPEAARSSTAEVTAARGFLGCPGGGGGAGAQGLTRSTLITHTWLLRAFETFQALNGISRVVSGANGVQLR